MSENRSSAVMLRDAEKEFAVGFELTGVSEEEMGLEASLASFPQDGFGSPGMQGP